MGNVFKKGYSAVREEKQRQDENREKMGRQLWRFFLTEDADEAPVRFLTEEPINFYEHSVKTVKNGKDRFESVICTNELGVCPLCESGDKPSFKGAFLIYDKRPFEYTDKNGKKQSGEGQLRLYVQGARVLSQLDRLSERYGLTSRDYIITRSGSGTSTTYMFDRTDEVSKLSETEISKMLPEKIRDMYDGSIDSLYEIVKNQLEMYIESSVGEGDSEVEEPPKPNKNILPVGETSKHKSSLSPKPLTKAEPKTGSSVKPLFKARKK